MKSNPGVKASNFNLHDGNSYILDEWVSLFHVENNTHYFLNPQCFSLVISHFSNSMAKHTCTIKLHFPPLLLKDVTFWRKTGKMDVIFIHLYRMKFLFVSSYFTLLRFPYLYQFPQTIHLKLANGAYYGDLLVPRV